MIPVAVEVVSIVLSVFTLLACITRESTRAASGGYWVPFESGPHTGGEVAWRFSGGFPDLSPALRVLALE